VLARKTACCAPIYRLLKRLGGGESVVKLIDLALDLHDDRSIAELRQAVLPKLDLIQDNGAPEVRRVGEYHAQRKLLAV
jgi:hypothetical protein